MSIIDIALIILAAFSAFRKSGTLTPVSFPLSLYGHAGTLTITPAAGAGGVVDWVDTLIAAIGVYTGLSKGKGTVPVSLSVHVGAVQLTIAWSPNA